MTLMDPLQERPPSTKLTHRLSKATPWLCMAFAVGIIAFIYQQIMDPSQITTISSIIPTATYFSNKEAEITSYSARVKPGKVSGPCGPVARFTCESGLCCGQSNTCGVSNKDCSIVPGGTTIYSSASSVVTGGSGGIGSDGNAVNSAGAPVQPGQAGCQPSYGHCYRSAATSTSAPTQTIAGSCGLAASLTCGAGLCCGQENTCGGRSTDCQIVPGAMKTRVSGGVETIVAGCAGGVNFKRKVAINKAGEPVESGQAGCQPDYGWCYKSSTAVEPQITAASISGKCGPQVNATCGPWICCGQSNICGVMSSDCKIVPGATATYIDVGSTLVAQGGSGGLKGNGDAVNVYGEPVQSGQAGCQPLYGHCYGSTPTLKTVSFSEQCGPSVLAACGGGLCCGQSNTCGVRSTDCQILPGITGTNSNGAVVTGGAGGIGKYGNPINKAGEPVQSGQAGCQPRYGDCYFPNTDTSPGTTAKRPKTTGCLNEYGYSALAPGSSEWRLMHDACAYIKESGSCNRASLTAGAMTPKINTGKLPGTTSLSLEFDRCEFVDPRVWKDNIDEFFEGCKEVDGRAESEQDASSSKVSFVALSTDESTSRASDSAQIQ